jgi:nitroimidazol reductase NimA-like FMN-containing flavoprotein (pyridoxamine 5'-phosphate oxidase superfamily)
LRDDTRSDERARRLIDASVNMTIATVDESGRPWVSPVFYSVDDERDLYWVSDKEALHSANVRSRPEVAIVIYETVNGVLDAVYIRATAAELNAEPEVRHGIEVMARKPQSEKWTIADVADVTGDAPWRIYRAVRKQTEVRVERTKQGKPVAGREPADF